MNNILIELRNWELRMNDVQTERTWKQQRFPDNIYILQAKLAYQFGRAVKGNHLLILSARHQLTTENWLPRTDYCELTTAIRYGGIHTNICIWSEHASASIIVTFSAHTVFLISLLYFLSTFRISPFSWVLAQRRYDTGIGMLNALCALFHYCFYFSLLKIS